MHCTIYDSNAPMMKKLPNGIIQLLTNIVNVKHLLYKYVNFMQQINNSSCGFFIITYLVDIMFKLNLEEPIYNVAQMPLHLHNNINNKNIFPLPKLHHNNKIVDHH